MARGSAAAGYVVYSYDRLGYAKSSYFSQPDGGTTLTTAAHQAELHQIVGEVQTGAFTTTTGSGCSAPQRPNRIRNRRVVIIGHSAGGWIVAGYPGHYHDVAAMIQADIRLLRQPPSGPRARRPAVGSRRIRPSRLLRVLPDPQNCQDFNTYPPGGRVRGEHRLHAAVPRLAVRRDHRPRSHVPAERRLHLDDRALGPGAAHLGAEDTTDPPVDADADYAYYKQHCGCDVTQLLLANTAHLFMVHQSLPIWLNDVVSWLASRRFRPTHRPPPVRCTDCVVPFVR